MFKLKLHWQILIALVLAVIFGLFFTPYVKYITWMGDLFLRALKMIIVPLILTSIISGVANIGGASNLGKLGLKTLTYYVFTSLLAILVGLTIVNLIQPGVGADLGFQKNVSEIGSSGDLGNILLRLVPTNIFDALVKADMLAVIFFSILFGYFITKIADEYKNPFINLINAGFEVMMKITSFVIKFAPLGILGIVAGVVAEQASDKAALMEIVQRLGLYMFSVLLGLIFHAFVTLPLILTVSLLKLESKYKVLTFPKILVSIVLLNLISWLFWGRSSTLLLTNTNNINTYYYKEILIEKGFSDYLPFYEVSFNDYSESTKNEFIEKLGVNKTKVANRIDWQSDSLDFEETPVFWVTIIRDFPLLSTISYGIIAGGGSVDFKSFYVWFFGWFEIRDELTGIS